MTTSFSPIGIGIVGMGGIAVTRHLPCLAKSPRYRIIAAYDLDPERAARTAQQFQISRVAANVQELFDADAIELIAILTPPNTHAALAHAALDAGKHLFVEKPLTLALAEAQELVAHVERAQKKLFLGFNQRRHRLVQQARAWLHQERLGEISAIHSTLTNNHDAAQRASWHSESAQGGELNFEVGVHHYDLWRYLTGSEIARVHAQTSQRHDDAQTLSLLAHLQNGIAVNALLVERTNVRGVIELFGERGLLILDLHRFDGLQFIPRGEFEGSVSRRAQRAAALVRESGVIARRLSRGGDYDLSYLEEWQHIAATLHSPELNEPNGYDGLAATQMALAVRESLTTHRTIELASIGSIPLTLEDIP